MRALQVQPNQSSPPAHEAYTAPQDISVSCVACSYLSITSTPKQKYNRAELSTSFQRSWLKTRRWKAACTMPRTLLLRVRIKSFLWAHKLSSFHLAWLSFSVNLFTTQSVSITQAIHLDPMQIKLKPQLSSKQSSFVLQNMYFDLIIAQALNPQCYCTTSGTWCCSAAYSYTPEVHSSASEKTTVWPFFVLVAIPKSCEKQSMGNPLCPGTF